MPMGMTSGGTDIAPRGAAARGFGVSLPLAVALIAFAATLGWGRYLLNDPDVYLHVAVGRWILAHQAVPHQDVFSYSMPGAPWVVHEWLAETAMALLYDWFGWAGLVLMAALCLAAAAGLLQRALMDYLTPAYALVGAATAIGLCYPHLLARPHAFSLPLLAAWTAMLVDAAARRRAPPLAGCLIIVLWANLHTGYIVALLLAALFGAEAMFEAADLGGVLRAARAWAIFGIAALAASLVTPNGIAGLMLPFDLIRMKFGLSFIVEWMSPNFQLGHPLEPWLMLVLLGALTLGVRVPVTRVAMFLLLLHVALQHQRLAEVLGVVTPLLFAPALGPQVNRHAVPRLDRWLAGLPRKAGIGALATAGMAALIVSAVVVRIGIANDDQAFAPRAALAAAAAQRPAGHVFNDINFGDYLIYSAAAAPFIDGRIDMYGDGLLRRYAAVGQFPDLVAEYGIGWALLAPANPHVPLLDNLPGWKRIYTDRNAVVFIKLTEPPDR